MSASMPKLLPGDRIKVFLPGDVERTAIVREISQDGEMVRVHYPAYPHLPNEWLPAKWF